MPIQLVYLFCIGYSSSLCRVCTLVQSETLVDSGKIFCTGTVVFRFVTGTHRMPHKYNNPKTEQTYRGVGSQEYNDVLQQHLIPEGNRLFQQAGRRAENLQLQQDDAPAHKTKGNMQCINNTVPGGHFLEWPQTHLTCPQLRIFGAGWSNSLTGRALTTLMTCKRG